MIKPNKNTDCIASVTSAACTISRYTGIKVGVRKHMRVDKRMTLRYESDCGRALTTLVAGILLPMHPPHVVISANARSDQAQFHGPAYTVSTESALTKAGNSVLMASVFHG